MDNSLKYKELREKYPDFVYHEYNVYEENERYIIEFHFEIIGLAEFRPQIILDKKYFSNIYFEDKHVKNLIFNMGMVELVSYLKITCSPNVSIKCGYLNNEQIDWFKKLYVNGLGEFFYTNNIPIDFDFITINTNKNKEIILEKSDKVLNGNLVPIGGGKDSCVTVSILKDKSINVTPFIVNPRGATLNTVKKSNLVEETITLTRTLDKNMLELNKQGFLNGHTPFSAMLAFLTNFVAYVTGKKYVVLSNESSANEPNVEGTNINHQYSKSVEFENDFRNYEKNYLKTGVEYFSLLRPLTELQITALFSKQKIYHDIFRSCNVGSKEDKWCSNCPKCLFVYIMLSAFLEKSELISIFGENLFEKKELKNTFIELIGKSETKPFECVGTYDEINYSICVAIKKCIDNNEKLDYLLDMYFNEYMNFKVENVENYINENKNILLHGYEINNNLPKEYETILKEKIKEEI